jgi:ParB/RepB/Spo0J family partition protein
MHARVKHDVDVLTLPVHPAADVFPMLDDDELSELANDIAENGLQTPLVVGELNGEMVLIDGRNRRRACQLVNVEPTYQLFSGDAVEFILSANIHRRHLTKGQRAMAVARVRLVSNQASTVRSAAQAAGISHARVVQAGLVIQFAPDLADSVLSGAASLDAAYQTAQQRKHASEGEEARFARLKAASPELATEVAEGRLTLQGAEAEWAERKARVRVQQVAVSKNIATFRLFDSNTATDKHLDEVASVLISAPDVFREAAGLTVDEYLSAITKIIERGHLILKRVKG